MEKINMREWIDGIIGSSQRVAIPIMTHPGIELCGKKVLDAVTDGEVHYEAIKLLSDKYPSAAATVIMDLTVEAEAFGAELSFSDDEVPSVIGRLLSEDADIENLQVPSLDRGRVQEFIKANRLAAENIKSKPVLAGCIGPISLAGRLYDMSEMMMLVLINPDLADKLLQKCTDFIIEYAKALKSTGVNGLVIAEPAAGLLSNDDCQRFSSVYVKQIVDAVQDDYFAVILHNCGNTGHCTEAMLYPGAMSCHFGNQADMTQIMKSIPEGVLAMGNLDPVGVFKQSTPQGVAKSTTDLLNSLSQYPNFVISSGCDTPPEVPFENIEAFYDALARYNKMQ